MAARKLSRREIKEDTFITATLKSWEYIRAHQSGFFIGLIVLIVIIIGSFWVQNSREKTHEEAVTQFSEALNSFRRADIKTAEELFKIVEDRFGGFREGVHASYFIGKCALLGGRNAEAIQAFDKYLGNRKKDTFFHDAAMDGKAVALENERRYAEAAEVYSELAKNIKTNSFMEKVYVRRAADNYKLSNQKENAIEMIERLLDLTAGVERRDAEIELEILRG